MAIYGKTKNFAQQNPPIMQYGNAWKVSAAVRRLCYCLFIHSIELSP